MSATQVEDRSSNSGSDIGRGALSQPSGEHEKYSAKEERSESFEDYPGNSPVNVIKLAKSGFFYSPARLGDTSVTCIGCSNVVDNWIVGDVPSDPRFHQPGCRYIVDGTTSRAQNPGMSERPKASVGGGDESTKPLEVASSSVPMSLPVTPSSEHHSERVKDYVQQQQPRGNVTTRYAASVPPDPHRHSEHIVTREIRRSSSRTGDVEHFHATTTHRASSSRGFDRTPSYSSTEAMSLQSSHPSAFHPSTGNFSNLTPFTPTRSVSYQPYEDQEQSYVSQVENSQDLQVFLDGLDMRIAQNRLYTFQELWSEDNEFRNTRLLVVCGFYCIGQGDAVECFHCHVVIANWSRNDNPRTRHVEMSPDCRFMLDEDCGNVPLPVETRRPRNVTPVPSIQPSMQSYRTGYSQTPRESYQGSLPSHNYPYGRSPSSSHSSSPSRSIQSQGRIQSYQNARGRISPQSSISPARDRQRHRVVSPQPASVHSSPHASMGPISQPSASVPQDIHRQPAHSLPYGSPARTPPVHSSMPPPPPLQNRQRLQPGNWANQPSSIQSSPGRISQPSSNLNRPVNRQLDLTASQRNNLLASFPCLRPSNPRMRDVIARELSFHPEFRRRLRSRASIRDFAEAGFYYIAGRGDQVHCWYCGGILGQFNRDDDPWTEHAKHYPHCEHLLQQRGPQWVHNISVLYPNVQRPYASVPLEVLPEVESSPSVLPPAPAPITDPTELQNHREALLNEGMALEPAQHAREMGYSENLIREVQWENICFCGSCYQSTDRLIEVLMDRQGQRGQQQHDSPPPSAHSTPHQFTGNAQQPQPARIPQPSGSNNPYPQNGNPPPRPTPNAIDHEDYNININGCVIDELVYPGAEGGQRQQNDFYVNGMPMDEYMDNIFDTPFFRGELDNFQTGHTVIHMPSPYRSTVTVNNDLQRNVGRQNQPRGNPADLRSPTPPPLRALDIPNLPRRSMSTGEAASSSSGSRGSGASGQSHAVSAAERERLRMLEQERLCKICLMHESIILFEPCRHICSCDSCSRAVQTCPVCRAHIRSRVRTYRS